VSLHYVAEALTALYWSRLSDHVGRKPVLLFCLAGTAASIVLFGFSRSFWTLVFRCSLPPVVLECAVFSRVYYSRCLHGALRGTLGVTKCAVAELTDETNMARGFSSLQFAWIVGYVIGSGILPKVPCLSLILLVL
jgi:MFS family permease